MQEDTEPIDPKTQLRALLAGKEFLSFYFKPAADTETTEREEKDADNEDSDSESSSSSSASSSSSSGPEDTDEDAEETNDEQQTTASNEAVKDSQKPSPGFLRVMISGFFGGGFLTAKVTEGMSAAALLQKLTRKLKLSRSNPKRFVPETPFHRIMS